jgi:DDE superfamily endonuclease
LGALYGVSQPTVSRVLAALREPVGVAAADGMPGVAEAGQAERLLVDGTLCPTGNRAGQQGEGLYSGKRHRAGMNTLVISDRWGRLVDASDPTPGAMHDARSFTETGLDRLLADRDVVGDLGFLAVGSARRCGNRLVVSCGWLSRSTTGRTTRLARRSSARSRC